MSVVKAWCEQISAGSITAKRNFYQEFNDYSCILEWKKGFYMVAKITKTAGNFAVWVNRSLTEEELKAYDDHPLDLRTKMDDTAVLVEKGYRLTLGYDAKGRCPICCLFAPDEGDENAGLAISARDTDAETAWGLVLYKHFEVLGETWPRQAPSPTVRRG